MPTFEKEEYDIRLAKVRKSMDEKNIEVLIVTDPSNMSWLTGYDGWSFYVHQCVVLALEGCLLYTSPSPRDRSVSRMPSSA